MKRRRLPLSPCDYLVFSHHYFMRRKGQGEYTVVMAVDVDGRVEPERLRAALQRTMAAHPTTLADLRVGLFNGKPYWRLPADPTHAAASALDRAYTYLDLRAWDAAEAEQRMSLEMNARLKHRWTVKAGPQIRLDHYDLPGGRTRCCLRWPHCLMDGEGGQLFLRQLSRVDEMSVSRDAPPHPLPPDLLPDHQPVDVLAGCSVRRKVKLACRALREMNPAAGLKIRVLPGERRIQNTGHGLVHRCWADTELARFQECARRWTPPGPARYARHLAAGTATAIHRLYQERGIDTDAYLMTLPLRVRAARDGGVELAARPVPGNYLVVLTLCLKRQQVADWTTLGEVIRRRMEDFRERFADLDFWAMVWAMSKLQVATQQLLLDLPSGFPPLATGFSYLGDAAERSGTTLAGAPIINLWDAGLSSTPPGWNLTCTRYANRLNLALIYNQPAISPGLAERYLDYVTEEVFSARAT